MDAVIRVGLGTKIYPESIYYIRLRGVRGPNFSIRFNFIPLFFFSLFSCRMSSTILLTFRQHFFGSNSDRKIFFFNCALFILIFFHFISFIADCTKTECASSTLADLRFVCLDSFSHCLYILISYVLRIMAITHSPRSWYFPFRYSFAIK